MYTFYCFVYTRLAYGSILLAEFAWPHTDLFYCSGYAQPRTVLFYWPEFGWLYTVHSTRLVLLISKWGFKHIVINVKLFFYWLWIINIKVSIQITNRVFASQNQLPCSRSNQFPVYRLSGRSRSQVAVDQLCPGRSRSQDKRRFRNF